MTSYRMEVLFIDHKKILVVLYPKVETLYLDFKGKNA